MSLDIIALGRNATCYFITQENCVLGKLEEFNVDNYKSLVPSLRG